MAVLRNMVGKLVQKVGGKSRSGRGSRGVSRKWFFGRSQNQVLGLDTGSAAVKMVELQKSRAGWSVTAAGIAEIANQPAGDSDAKAEINTAKAINQCLKSSGSQTRLAVCGVCGPEVAVRSFKFPTLPPAEIEGAVLLEASQVCPFNIEESTVDYQVIPDGKEFVSGVLVAATNKLIERKRQASENASLGNVLMDVDGLALLNCFAECEKPKNGKTTAILNVGNCYTNLAIMGNNNVPFVRDIAYAGDDIVKELARENNVSPEAVSKLLSGCEDGGAPRLELSESLGKACAKLITDVAETLRYYSAQEKSAAVDEIFVCGGFALVKGFVEVLDSRLAAKAVLWNPFEQKRCEADSKCRDIIEKHGPAMAVAAGLAMRSI
ncbi:MAG: type IV pilus assembly protein PilM [Planctomycetota bacterium]|nr:MAG: type IV pilus assembly protein PilM [Planctomycetota bacterium]